MMRKWTVLEVNDRTEPLEKGYDVCIDNSEDPPVVYFNHERQDAKYIDSNDRTLIAAGEKYLHHIFIVSSYWIFGRKQGGGPPVGTWVGEGQHL